MWKVVFNDTSCEETRIVTSCYTHKCHKNKQIAVRLALNSYFYVCHQYGLLIGFHRLFKLKVSESPSSYGSSGSRKESVPRYSTRKRPEQLTSHPHLLQADWWRPWTLRGKCEPWCDIWSAPRYEGVSVPVFVPASCLETLTLSPFALYTNNITLY